MEYSDQDLGQESNSSDDTDGSEYRRPRSWGSSASDYQTDYSIKEENDDEILESRGWGLQELESGNEGEANHVTLKVDVEPGIDNSTSYLLDPHRRVLGKANTDGRKRSIFRPVAMRTTVQGDWIESTHDEVNQSEETDQKDTYHMKVEDFLGGTDPTAAAEPVRFKQSSKTRSQEAEQRCLDTIQREVGLNFFEAQDDLWKTTHHDQSPKNKNGSKSSGSLTDGGENLPQSIQKQPSPTQSEEQPWSEQLWQSWSEQLWQVQSELVDCQQAERPQEQCDKEQS